MNKRSISTWVVLVISALIWLPSSPVIKLIIENDPVILGRYSAGHFGALLLLTVIFWIAAAVLFSTRNKAKGETIFALVMVYLSAGVSGFVLVVGSGMINKPRFIEQAVHGVDPDTGIVLSGVVRHRPPNERFDLLQKDVPEQVRSYPNAPAGYPEFPLVLTSDSRGYRNADNLQQYDVVAVGDSFVAGSHVSDEQAWVELLRKSTGQTIYNTGVSGTDPLTYLNNFITVGRAFKPKTVLLMLYEGNDFRDAPPLPTVENTKASASAEDKSHSLGFYAKASPVTKGLRRLAEEVLAKIGSQWPVAGYAEKVGFMPLRLNINGKQQAYSFEPKRLHYLANDDQQAFAASSDWKNVRDVLEKFELLSKKDGFRLVMVYAPSTPHVILPLMEKEIPAQQLRNFMDIKNKKNIAMDAEAYKQQIFSRLDSNEDTWMAWCKERGVACVSTTAALRQAAANGQQVYYTYDQHWTPEGNAVTARVVDAFLRQLP